MKYTQDAWWPAPELVTIQVKAAEWGVPLEQAAARLLEQREALLASVKADPYRQGYEPSIWWVAWALMDFPYVQQGTAEYLAGRLGVPVGDAWQVFKKRMRQVLGFAEPVRDLLIMGANRSSKTDFGAKTVMRYAVNVHGGVAMFLAQQYSQSAETVQPRLWQYFPPEWKRKHMGEDWYVHYKDLKGFSEAQFQLPSGTKVIGKFYSQDPKDALIGSEAGLGWADELIPIHWMDELGRRLASKQGQLVLTFTPIDGYTPVVKSFLDGASIVRSIPAYLLPRDGGERWPHAALGLSREQYARWQDENRRKALHTVRATVPEDCVSWIEEGSAGSGQLAVGSDGRKWETAPRVARCFDPKRAVVWFEVFDNPYANPAELIAREADKGADRVRTILYGIAVKSRSATFSKYNELVHVIEDDEIPETGFNYCIMDPAGTRNNAIAWIRSTPDGDYVYREWPGSYHIPGVGVPGPWAKSSGRKKGWNDGDPDEGSASFGFGFARMKYEIARLEGWKDCLEWEAKHAPLDVEDGVAVPDEEEVRGWSEEHGAREVVESRFMDSRPAAAVHMGIDGEKTLLDEWNELEGWDWNTTPGDSVDKGLDMIVNALAYQDGEAADEAGDAVGSGQLAAGSGEGGGSELPRMPWLRIAKSCRNIRFALATYTGADGQKGAVKDMVDLLRYFFKLGLARCGGADPLRVSALYGPGARRAMVERRVVMQGAGGTKRTGIVVEAGRGAVGSGQLAVGSGRGMVRAGGVRTGGAGARFVWRGGR